MIGKFRKLSRLTKPILEVVSVYLLLPFAYIPQGLTHFFGRLLGRLSYHVIIKWRKRTLSNLSLATKLNLNEKELIKVAIASFENLGILFFEYPKMIFRKNFLPVRCENPEYAEQLIKKNKGVIFFCGHQANWELLFLEGTSRMPGVAIGRPIKQKSLYNRIIKMREKYGGVVIPPKKAIKEGLRALKKGKFLGIVGDQGMPESDFSAPFLGRRAFSTTAPALLSIKTKSPLIVATIRRENKSYVIHYSDPVCETQDPNKLMEKALQEFEKSILAHPDQWLWTHNRWKQETPVNVLYRYRHDSILIIVDKPFDDLKVFRKIYPRAFITLLSREPFEEFDTILYKEDKELFLKSYKYKLVINLTSINLKRHFLKKAAFEVLSSDDLIKRSGGSFSFEERVIRALCRRGSLWS
ncbi:MAG: hypothetical protein WDZ28_03850 [Simkaniaceae bacterium]